MTSDQSLRTHDDPSVGVYLLQQLPQPVQLGLQLICMRASRRPLCCRSSLASAMSSASRALCGDAGSISGGDGSGDSPFLSWAFFSRAVSASADGQCDICPGGWSCTHKLLHAKKQAMTSRFGDRRLTGGFILLLLHPTSLSFNLLDGIWMREGTESTGPGRGDVTGHMGPSAWAGIKDSAHSGLMPTPRRSAITARLTDPTMLHLAWCLAVSAAATRCRTGSHTMDCGSRRIQSRNMAASSSVPSLRPPVTSNRKLKTHHLAAGVSCHCAAYKLEAAADGGLDVGAAEGGDLAELPGDLDGVVEEEAQAALVAEARRTGNLPEQDWRKGGGGTNTHIRQTLSSQLRHMSTHSGTLTRCEWLCSSRWYKLVRQPYSARAAAPVQMRPVGILHHLSSWEPTPTVNALGGGEGRGGGGTRGEQRVEEPLWPHTSPGSPPLWRNRLVECNGY
ncbi:hypothetical protein EYF80_043430 [Liparis tanakae]|uniref:Uncharacterized protein n=1 Tax=Liparis tanakae TaxID=230148 RepID=A0A4Z2FZQ3_9TELE|nr:hypothetical protein EYF80_043430 [Liparis tanakae]